jgi:hypothetical protein
MSRRNDIDQLRAALRKAEIIEMIERAGSNCYCRTDCLPTKTSCVRLIDARVRKGWVEVKTINGKWIPAPHHIWIA